MLYIFLALESIYQSIQQSYRLRFVTYFHHQVTQKIRITESLFCMKMLIQAKKLTNVSFINLIYQASTQNKATEIFLARL